MTVPPLPPTGAHGGWNPPPAAAPGYLPPGHPQGGYVRYGYPPPPPPPGTNGFAIGALICGIFGIIGGALPAVILAVLGLSQIKKTGQKGRGLAITGLVLTGMWVLGFAAIVAVGISSGAHRDTSGTIAQGGRLNADSLRVGDCLNDIQDSDNVKSLPGVPCAVAHEGEVYAVFDLPDGPYSGNGTNVPDSASGECTIRFGSYAPTAAERGTFGVSVVYPLKANWALGERTVDCIATAADNGRTTGSVKGK